MTSSDPGQPHRPRHRAPDADALSEGLPPMEIRSSDDVTWTVAVPESESKPAPEAVPVSEAVTDELPVLAVPPVVEAPSVDPVRFDPDPALTTEPEGPRHAVVPAPERAATPSTEHEHGHHAEKRGPQKRRPAAATTSKRRPRRRLSTGRRALRTVLVLGCVGVLAVTGLVWAGAYRMIGGFTLSHALGSGPRSSGGAENILLMGLDTRRDQNGDPLPQSILDELHAGTSDNGGYNTNTLILVHIPADKKNIVAYSIPRDDYVTVEGLDVSHAKIKEAYGRRKAAEEDELQADGVTDPSELEHRGREAGRAETIATVRRLTGVPIDHFAEVSLVGFYDLAQGLGGVDVCLNHSVHDDYSGADFPAGVQTLDGSQSVAFVRQRHGLDNGDLDRTHRQQAFLLSVLHKLQSVGTLSNVGKLNVTVRAAQKDVVISDGWNLPAWAASMNSVSGQHITFRTLPVKGYSTVDGQDVNVIDPSQIRSEVQRAFGVKQTPSPDADDDSTDDTTDAGSDTATSDGGWSEDGTDSQDTASPDSSPATDSATPPPDSGGAVTDRGGVPCVD
ncbi:MAG: LCP family protein [Gordonia sp. (in: high G+C Gram-positive bacteria)]|uniref:LCP family glycopolymer transferase n=1 Tax=Gordonia sp. (in: high G+C Gram-positive bacteria) TaxID=84139 RepID=UPI0039E23F5D